MATTLRTDYIPITDAEARVLKYITITTTEKCDIISFSMSQIILQ